VADIDLNLKGNAEKGINAISAALKAAEQDTKAAQKALEQMAKDAEKAAKEAEKNSLAKMFERSQISANLATTAAEKFLDTLIEFGRTIPEGAAATDRHERSLAALGNAYGLVEHATRGVVSAEQAAQVQSRLSQAGLRLTGQELANVTQRAREYARVNNVEVGQALEMLTDQLLAPGDELRKFGVTIQSGRTKTEGMRDALRQLAEQSAATTPSQLTLTEATDRFTRSTDLAKASLQNLIAEKLNLKDFFDQAASWLQDVTEGTNGWQQALEAARGTAREAARGNTFQRAVVGALAGTVGSALLYGADGDATETPQNQSASGAFASTYSGALADLRRAGVNTRGYPTIGQLVGLNDDERRRVLAMVQREAAQARARGSRANLSGARGLFDQDVPTGPSLGSEGPQESTAQAIADLGTTARARAEREQRERAAAARAEAARVERERRAQIQRELAAAMGPTDVNALRAAQMAHVQAQLDAQTAGVAATLGMSGGAGDPTQVRQARLDALRRSATATEAQRGENEASRLQRVASAVQAYVQALRQYREEDGRLEQQLRASAQAEKDRTEAVVEGLRTGQDATRRRMTSTLGAADEELQLRRGIDAAENPGGRGDRRRQQERLRDLVELRQAYGHLLEQTDERLAQARAEGRDQNEINGLMQERLGLLRAMGAATQELTAIQREQSAATAEFKDSMVNALGATADAFAGAAVAAIDTGRAFDEVLGEMLREQLKALAKEAIVQTLKNTALGFAALAGFQPGSATSYFTAAALWGAVGIASGVTLAATRPSSAANASEKNGGSRESAGRPSAARPDSGNGGGPLVMNFNVSGALFNDGVTEQIAQQFRRAQSMGLLPQGGGLTR